MKIDELIQLLNNRLREFSLSRDYAKMNGDFERMNVAEKEIIGLEDTLYKLNLLIDTTKSAAVKESTLAEVMTDGSVSVLGEYDIKVYNSDPLYEKNIMNILSKMGVMDTAEKINDYIKGKYLSSPVTGEMIVSASLAYKVDERLMMAMMQQDSSFGTAGLSVGTLNPGNNNDGNTRTYGSWQEGVTAVAEWLSRHRGSTPISDEEVMTDGSISVLGKYDITVYATDPLHEQKIMNILSKMGVMDTAEKIDDYIKSKYPSSPVNGGMVMSAALAYSVDVRLIIAMMEQDSSLGTAGLAVRTLNPGNVGNDDDGNIRTYGSWQEGVTAVAEWLSRHRGSTPIFKTSGGTVATSTSTSGGQATSTSPIIIPTTSTTTTSTSTPITSTSTPISASSTPITATSTSETIPVVTSTTVISTSTPVTSSSTPITATSTSETIPVVTSTTVISTSTPVTATPTAN